MPRYFGMPTAIARALQRDEGDAYGNPPERVVNESDAAPCRHCLDHVARGDAMLICAHRPYFTLQPYAETGPVFLCARACAPYEGAAPPPVLRTSPDYLLKAYSDDERIIYGTGAIVPRDAVDAHATELLARAEVAFVDVRSARNNCWQVRISR